MRYRPRTMVAAIDRFRISLRAIALGWFVAATALPAFAKTSGESEAGASDASASDGTEDGSAKSTDAGTDNESGETGDSAGGAAPAPKSGGTSAKDTSHGGQFHVRLDLVAGYRIVMRYDESPLCAAPDGKEPRKFCGFSAPLGLETAIGYAPTSGIEPFLWGRFGLGKESETQTAPLVAVGAGLRLYTMSDAPFKFFIEPAIGMELEKGASGATDNAGKDYAQDWLLRLGVGPQYDINRYVGIYFAGSMTVGVVRALHSFMDLHGGVQARFP